MMTRASEKYKRKGEIATEIGGLLNGVKMKRRLSAAPGTQERRGGATCSSGMKTLRRGMQESVPVCARHGAKLVTDEDRYIMRWSCVKAICRFKHVFQIEASS
jgi:hypothetical protein